MAETETDDLNDGELAPIDRALRTARPGLSSAAMERIHAAMNRELAARNAGKRSDSGAGASAAIQAWPLYAAIAALVLLALTMAIYSFTMPPRENQSSGINPADPGYGIPRDELMRRRSDLLLKFLKMDRGDEGGRARVAAELLRITPDADIPETTTPGELRFLGALGFAAPHLQWHAPFLNEKSENMRVWENLPALDFRWSDAHEGERWMAEAAPPDPARIRPADGSFWTLDDPTHGDVKRAIALLSDLKSTKEIASRAAEWTDALRRNNTVLTMDVIGGYHAGKSADIVLDARAADHVTFTLYRVRKPADLLAVARRIGADFIFADHDLELQKAEMQHMRLPAAQRAIPDPPRFAPDNAVQEWSCDLSKLKTTQGAWRDREDWGFSEIDEDGDYFGDQCADYAQRLNREYGRARRATSWRCGRIVSIPAEGLKTAGAYVLVAEANGQQAFAPIIVDPLDLALRRCRDGVLTIVSEHNGAAPVADATVLADGLLQDAVTDANGVAFARVFAGGDRGIIAWRDGRAAIGGFGRLFDGVYGMSSRWGWCGDMISRSTRTIDHSDSSIANVYEDRNVVAAYTDRPVYRPGQDVNFKLILRMLGGVKGTGGAATAGFRDEDFEKSKNLTLPISNSPIAYEVLDSKNRAVAAGATTVNDFGTAIGSLRLNDEAATGSYALRLNLGGTAHIVPDVFSVKSYRRPNFEVKLSGVPATLSAGSTLALKVNAQYYFGQPVTASGHLRLVRADAWRPLAESDFKIDAGAGSVELPIPADLFSGKYFVICAVTDDSNQTVTRSETTTVSAPAAGVEALSSVPKFVPLGAELKIAVPANLSIAKAEQMNADVPTSLEFAPVNGLVTVKFTHAGWWTIYCGSEYAVVFVYGEAVTPFATSSVRTSNDANWVNLAVYGGENSPQETNNNLRTPDLWALFDRQHAEVGGTLKLLVYVPHKAPRILFTYEGRTVVDYTVVSPAGNGPYYVIELPIRARHVPNFYLQACLLSPSGADSELMKAQKLEDSKENPDGADPRWCRVDVIDPGASHGGERLIVSIESDANHHPGDDVNVGIRVTAPNGDPRSAEVSFSAVDESVFSFGDDNVSSLATTFADARPPRLFLPKAWRISSEWQQARLMQCARDAMAQAAEVASQRPRGALERSFPAPQPALRTLGQMPAGQIPLLNWREDFRETAAWLPQLHTDANGRATATFKLPDSLTRYRLTAVGLTKETEIGTGKSALTASLPLSVQVFAPRFAIEGDQLQLTGIIRNDSDAATNVPYAWQIEKAAPRTDIAGSAVSGKVSLEPHSSATIHVVLAFAAIGDARVGLKAGDAAITDGERRTVTVYPDGRPLEVALNGNARADKGEFKLPAGYIPYDLTLALTRSDPSHMLNDSGGLGYLIEYPYGCVEQTMSRFLPAVVVKHAAQQGSAVLSDEVLKRMPDVLNAGLARLYKFQHEDGGWGWWEKDQTNQRMSVYVLYGLARCKACGVSVDASVIEKACAFLKVELKFGRLDPELTAWAWDALALAGAADTDGLTVQIRTLQPFNERARGYLALACDNVNLKTDARFIWTTIKGWQPVIAEDLALKLNLDLAFGELPQARDTAAKLSALRHGLRWASTWDTARAIEALSALTTKAPPLAPARSMRVSINGTLIYEAKSQEALQHRIFTVHPSNLADLDRTQKEATVRIEADCPEPVQYALNSTGYQKLSDSAATGTDVRMTRQYFSHDGKPLSGPVKNGDAIEAHVKVTVAHPQTYMLVEDRRPAGFEFAADIIQGADARSAANVEFRDDRICVFFDSLSAGEHEFIYYLRAENVGTSHVIPGCAYPMYNEKVRGETAPATLEVVEK